MQWMLPVGQQCARNLTVSAKAQGAAASKVLKRVESVAGVYDELGWGAGGSGGVRLISLPMPGGLPVRSVRG